MKCGLFLVTIILSTQSITLSASQLTSCLSEVFERPDPIKRNTKADVTEHEYRSFGIKAENGSLTSANLKAGKYIYVITNKGVYYSNEIPNYKVNFEAANTEAFVTHRSLYQSIQNRSDIQVYAAGEFVMAAFFNLSSQRWEAGLQLINNRSNTFRGKQTNLDFAAKELGKLGLPVDVKVTPLMDYSIDNRYNSHFYFEVAALAEIRLQNDPLKLKFDAAEREWIKEFPDPKFRGRMDAALAQEAVIEVIEVKFDDPHMPFSRFQDELIYPFTLYLEVWREGRGRFVDTVKKLGKTPEDFEIFISKMREIKNRKK